MTEPCPVCAPDGYGGGCPNCDGKGYVSKKADVSPGTNPERKPSEACEKPCDDQEGIVTLSGPGKVSGPIEHLYEELVALRGRVEALEEAFLRDGIEALAEGEFGK